MRPNHTMSQDSRSRNFSCRQYMTTKKRPPWVSLENLTPDHCQPLLPIVQNPYVMQWIATGRTWTKYELDNKLAMSKRDWESTTKRGRNHYCWAILAENRICGIFQVSKNGFDSEFRSRCFLGPEYQERGIGTLSREMALAKLVSFDSSIWRVVSEIRPENKAALKSTRKSGFRFVGPSRIGKVNLLQFEIDPNPITRTYLLCSKPVGSHCLLNEIQRGLPFPYHRYFLPPPAEMFLRLCNVLDNMKVLESDDSTAAGHYDVPFQGQYTTIVRGFPFEFWTTDALSNYYTEEVRIWCRRLKFETLGEAWSSSVYHEYIATSFTDTYTKYKDARPVPYKQGGDIARALRETLLTIPHIRECNIFNPALGVYLIRRLAGAGARVLDPSAGWGDRLLAALASGAECYHGYDPNPRLQHGYSLLLAAHLVEEKDKEVSASSVHETLHQDSQRSMDDGWTLGRSRKKRRGRKKKTFSSAFSLNMTDKLNPIANVRQPTSWPEEHRPTSHGASCKQSLPSMSKSCPKNFWLRHAPYERQRVLIRKEYYDIVLSSPPYYDVEIYDDNPQQALNAYPSKDLWVKEFLTVYLEKAWASLRKGGHMALYMENFLSLDIVSEVSYIVGKFPDSEFLGVIGFRQECTTSDKVRPTWIWRKLCL